MHLAPDPVATGYDAAQIAEEMPAGADPVAIPTNPPKGFRMGLNLFVVFQYGLVIPSLLLLLAGDNLYS